MTDNTCRKCYATRKNKKKICANEKLNLSVCHFTYCHMFLVPRAPPLQVNASNSSSSSILVTWQRITSSSVPGILVGYVLRIIKADDTNASNFRELEHDLSTSRNITNLETYTLYNVSVAGYTRVGIGNFSEAQSWTDEGGKDSYKQDERFCNHG